MSDHDRSPGRSTVLRLVDPVEPDPPSGDPSGGVDPSAVPRYRFATPPSSGPGASAGAVASPTPSRGPATGPAVRAQRSAGDVVWPSVEWLAHASVCPDGRKCRHPAQFPGWWLDMVTRGIPYASDADESLQRAVSHVHRFNGHPHLLPEPLTFTKQAGLDALSVAPAPVTKSWVGASLSAVSGLARWVHTTGQPLTRRHVFDEETRRRYTDGAAHLDPDTSRLYSARLELIADHLNGAVVKRLPRGAKKDQPPIEPLTWTEEADLWGWTRGLRPLTRRARVQAFICLGLGVGLTRAEKCLVRRDDVDLAHDGVHVTVTNHLTGAARRVTCHREWEERLAALTLATAPGRYLLSPWTDKAPNGPVVDQTIAQTHAAARPPLIFNNVRLRNTWLCRHLEAGTPLKTLMVAADLKEATHLVALLGLMPDASPRDASAALRGAR